MLARQPSLALVDNWLKLSISFDRSKWRNRISTKPTRQHKVAGFAKTDHHRDHRGSPAFQRKTAQSGPRCVGEKPTISDRTSIAFAERAFSPDEDHEARPTARSHTRDRRVFVRPILPSEAVQRPQVCRSFVAPECLPSSKRQYETIPRRKATEFFDFEQNPELTVNTSSGAARAASCSQKHRIPRTASPAKSSRESDAMMVKAADFCSPAYARNRVVSSGWAVQRAQPCGHNHVHRANSALSRFGITMPQLRVDFDAFCRDSSLRIVSISCEKRTSAWSVQRKRKAKPLRVC